VGVAFGIWNGRSIRWKSKTHFSISTGWGRLFSTIAWIFMVYPHLDCRLDCHRPFGGGVELDSPRVQAILDGLPAPEYVIEERIQVPAQMYAWKRSESGRNRRWPFSKRIDGSF